MSRSLVVNDITWESRARLLLAALAAFFVVMAAFASRAQAEVFRVTNKKDSGARSSRDAIDDTAPRDDKIAFIPDVLGTITFSMESGA